MEASASAYRKISRTVSRIWRNCSIFSDMVSRERTVSVSLWREAVCGIMNVRRLLLPRLTALEREADSEQPVVSRESIGLPVSHAFKALLVSQPVGSIQDLIYNRHGV